MTRDILGVLPLQNALLITGMTTAISINVVQGLFRECGHCLAQLVVGNGLGVVRLTTLVRL